MESSLVMYICPKCGGAYQGTGLCPRDGTPLVPATYPQGANAPGVTAPAAYPQGAYQQGATPPAAYPQGAYQQGAYPQGGYPPPPAAKKRISGGIIAAIVIVVCLALGLGTFFVVRAVRGGVANPTVTTPTGPTTTATTALPPDSASQWANGVKQAWTINPFSTDNQAGWVWAQTPDYVLFDNIVDTNTLTTVVDRSSGQTLWQLQNESILWCDFAPLDGSEVWCNDTTSSGHYVTNRYAAGTGDLLGTIDTAGLKLPIPAGKDDTYGFNGVTSQYGMVFATYTTKPYYDTCDYTLLRLSDDGSQIMWQAPYTFCTGNAMSSSDRLQHGVLTNSLMYAIEADSGKVLPVCSNPQGCANIEWVADNVLMGDLSTPQQVTFPDGTPGVLVGPGAISVSSTKLPPNPLRIWQGNLEAYDPMTGQALWSTAVSLSAPDSSNGLISNIYAAYDGQRIVVTDTDGNVVALDPTNGTLLWSTSLPVNAPRTIPDFLDDGLLLISQTPYADSVPDNGQDGMVFGLDPATGLSWWQQPGQIAGTQIDCTPFLGNQAGFPSVLVQRWMGDVTSFVPNG